MTHLPGKIDRLEERIDRLGSELELASDAGEIERARKLFDELSDALDELKRLLLTSSMPAPWAPRSAS
jgi:hypothetical protein